MQLREWLKKYKITQRQFCQLIQISPIALEGWLCKRSEPSMQAALLIEIITDGQVTAEELRPKGGFRYNRIVMLEDGVKMEAKPWTKKRGKAKDPSPNSQ